MAAILMLVGVGCEGLNKALKDVDSVAGQVADATAPPDAVTGARRLQLVSESQQIEQAEKAKSALLEACRANAVAVDADAVQTQRLRRIFSNITQVSHVPEMPWEIFLIEVPDDNAFTIGGGKVFVLRGLFGGLVVPDSDDELAAVIAHEVAHVTCGHLSEHESWKVAALVSRNLRKRFWKDAMFKGSFSSQQEDEADRIGLLYMALAGYDPAVVGPMWARAHEKYGSAPGDYTYDHPLNRERAQKVAELSKTASRYYRGREVRNPDYQALLLKNDLVEGLRLQSDSGLLKLLEAFSNTFVEYQKARTEEEKRKKIISEIARKYLVIHNQTRERVRVFVNLYTKGRSGFQWFKWGDAGSYWDLQPGQRTRLSMPDGYVLEGTSAEVWAESTSRTHRWPRAKLDIGGYGNMVQGEFVYSLTE